MKKKNFYDFLGFSIFKHSPESFKLYFKGSVMDDIPSDILYDFGITYITKGEDKLTDEVKRFFRTKSKFKTSINKKHLAIRTTDGGFVKLDGYWKVNVYDTKSKLLAYKEIKDCIKEQRYAAPKVTSVTLDGNYNANNIQESIYTPEYELLKRVVFL